MLIKLFCLGGELSSLQRTLRSKKYIFSSYEDARGALRRKQDKEREAAGLPPAQRSGGRGAVQRAQRGGAGARGRGATPLHRGGTSSRTIHTTTDKHLYVHLLGHLRKQGLLPVIVFTLSKKRCEENAATLTNQDLSTSSEKSEIHVTIENALSRLKGSRFEILHVVLLMVYRRF
jgi:antiviral helicase SKI2